MDPSTAIQIELTPPVNLRDLAGIPITGGRLRDGFVIRSDDLSTIGDQHADDLVERGLRNVIDLRSKEEVAYTGRGTLAGHPVAYHHIPLLGSIGNALAAEGSDAAALGMGYASLVEHAASQLTGALAIIATSSGTTAFHCSAGKDRTGVLAAALLLALGASDADIIADYGRTEPNGAAIMTRLRPVLGVVMQRAGVDFDTMVAAATNAAFSDQAMRTMLLVLRDRHGDPLTPLRTAGLDDGIVALLRKRALAA